jgi:hypothetical protein
MMKPSGSGSSICLRPCKHLAYAQNSIFIWLRRLGVNQAIGASTRRQRLTTPAPQPRDDLNSQKKKHSLCLLIMSDRLFQSATSTGFGFSISDFPATLKLVGTIIDALREAFHSTSSVREVLSEVEFQAIAL